MYKINFFHLGNKCLTIPACDAQTNVHRMLAKNRTLHLFLLELEAYTGWRTGWMGIILFQPSTTVAK